MTSAGIRVVMALCGMAALSGCGGGSDGAGSTGNVPVVSAPTPTPTGTAPAPTEYRLVDYGRDFAYEIPLSVDAAYFTASESPPIILGTGMAGEAAPFRMAFTSGTAEEVRLDVAGQRHVFGIGDRLATTPVRFYVKGPDTLRLGISDTNIRLAPRFAQMALWNYGCTPMVRADHSGLQCFTRYFAFGEPSPIQPYANTGIDYSGPALLLGSGIGSPAPRLEGNAIVSLHPHPAVRTLDGSIGFNARNADGSLGPRIHLLFKMPFDPLVSRFAGAVADQQGGLTGTISMTLFGPSREEIGFAFRVADPAGTRSYVGIGIIPRT